VAGDVAGGDVGGEDVGAEASASAAIDARASARGRRIARAVLSASQSLVARGGEALVVLFVLGSLVFFALRLLPGDPAALVLGDQASATELAALRAKLHLDEPLGRQFVRFVTSLPTLDFGDSIRRPGVSARARILLAIGPTAALAGVAVGMASVLGITVALLARGPWLGTRRVWAERAANITASLPLLSFAPLVTYALAARLRVVPLPGDPEAGVSGLLFASTLLALPLAAHVARIGVAALEDVARAPFLAVARAKGGGALRVWVLHALAASLGPIVTVIATQLGALLGGAVVLERLFEREGLGTLILEAYATRDLPVLEGAVIAAGALFVVTQALAAAMHAAFDPRVRA
jgi:peptide/nickel transport system permease protein